MTTYSILGLKEKGLHTLTKNKMLEKDLWSHSPDGMFSTSGDNESLKEETSLASDGPSMSNHGLKTGNLDSVGGEFCADDSILVDKCATEVNDAYCFPLNHIREADDDLSFFNNHHEDKEKSDLLYYGWGDIDNFDEVDRMFRSCDSTFGFGSLSNEDDLCWFSSSQVTEGSHDALKADAKLNNIPQHASSGLGYAVSSTIESGKKSVHSSDNIGSRGMKDDNAGFAHTSCLYVSNEESESKDGSTLIEQISPPKKQLKQLSASGERKDHHLDNGDSFYQCGNIKQSADVKHTFNESSCQFFSASSLKPHKQNVGPDSLSYVQTNVPHKYLNYISSLDQSLECPTLSSTKSENNGNPSSTNESSYASDQVQSIESSSGSIIINEKRGNLHYQQDTQAPLKKNVKHAKVGSKMAFYDPVTVQKQFHQSEQDGHSEVRGVCVRKPAELDSSNDRLSSCMSSVLDEVSLEASGFWKLQQVLEKLDIRTKLCIRDSLYRLARSAEQRHTCTNTEGDTRNEKDMAGSSVATTKCTGLLDMETGTNPIDRSIAHLLFHRPSGSNINPRSRGMIHG